jgi:hypothetical protein
MFTVCGDDGGGGVCVSVSECVSVCACACVVLACLEVWRSGELE